MPDRKLIYVSVSWLGHPDRRVANIDEARAEVDRACRRGPKPVIGPFSAPVEGDDYGRKVRWERANWWREGDSPAKYSGAIVCVYEGGGA